MSENLKEANKKNSSLSASFTRHPWLKLIALVLAILIWFYVQGELYIPY